MNNTTTNVTILMPLFNGVEFLSESVQSVIYQTYANWNLIIGVNGYSENSKVFSIAQEYSNVDSRIKVLDLFRCNGKIETLLTMLQYVDSDCNWIALLDVDDKWMPNKLAKQIPFTNQFDVIGTMCQYFGNSILIPSLPMYDFSYFNFLQFNPIINSSVLLKKCYCLWNTKMVVEDYELWLMLRSQQLKFYNVPDILVRHRIHNESAFNTKDFSKEIEEFKRKYG